MKILGTVLVAALAFAPPPRPTSSPANRPGTITPTAAPTSHGVTLVKQLSHAGCWKGDTWGTDKRGIWVANGCRAEFQTGYKGRDWDATYERNNDGKKVSDGEKVAGAILAAGVIAAVANEAEKHHDDRSSGHYDSKGNYHYDSKGYDSNNHRYYYNAPNSSTVTCESTGHDHTYCSVGYTYRVELRRQLSRANCSYNRTWGYDRKGIWVSDGCRGEFKVY
ncbi:MAG: DUF3011 domain-containing protein [Thermoanaerobaculia bacterium]